MAVLKYITKGNRSPQGVPRVYFCCHPDEQSLFLEPVAKLLLEKQSCAVFYLEDPAGERDADFWADLKQVQLFVMPVTTRLLTTENPAMEEFRFAVENHIPVLPLMQESGLDKIFAEKCGDLQYLDPNARDDTALSFDEKLSKYLQNVLIGDELAEKIRAAFDAYVFLSYRKKDRRYAQELMRLIHKNDFCRDIAIWYDEFLTPGENFNDSIREALEKSGLFVLAVTPNLVNEVNYIMTTEYPMAQTAGKPILPAEMVTTDGAALAEHYPSIPAITDAHNEEALTAALLEKVKGLAILENDTSPEHNFFIGLAYLGGVDVETDHERALALITGAAEAGLPEAMKKLVSMYREGLGVARNYQTAIAWQRRVAEYYRNAYETDQTEKAGFDYLFALWDLGDYIYETRQIPAAGAVYTEMLRFCGNLQDTYGTNNRIRRYLSVAYNKVGNIYEATGKLSEALSRYEASLELRRQLAEETGTVEAHRDLSISYDNVGNIYRAMGQLSEALSRYEAFLELAKQLAEETGTVEARRDLSVSYDKVGNIYRAMGKLSEALSRYEASLELAKQLAEETSTVKARRDLSISYDKVGNIYEATGKLSEALSRYEASLELAKQLAEETGTVEARRDLSVSYNNVGNIYEAMGKLSEALSRYEASMELAKQLAEETRTIESEDDLAVSHYRMGNVTRGAERQSHYREAYRIWDDLARRYPENPAYAQRRDIVKLYLN